MSFRKYNEGQPEAGPSRLSFIDSTFPDPVEMVRQYEEDEKLARILQEYHTSDYIEHNQNLLESARVARQLQAEFDNEMPEVLSPRHSTASRTQNQTADGDVDAGDEVVGDSEPKNEASGDSGRRDGASKFSEFFDIEQGCVGHGDAGRAVEIEDRKGFADEFYDMDDEEESEDDYDDLDDNDYIDDYDYVHEAEIEQDMTDGLEEHFDDDENDAPLRPREIQRLPTRIHAAPPSSKGASETKVCQICHESYANGDELRILTCFHEFHTLCVDPWLLRSGTCPVCRIKVDLTPH